MEISKILEQPRGPHTSTRTAFPLSTSLSFCHRSLKPVTSLMITTDETKVNNGRFDNQLARLALPFLRDLEDFKSQRAKRPQRLPTSS